MKKDFFERVGFAITAGMMIFTTACGEDGTSYVGETQVPYYQSDMAGIKLSQEDYDAQTIDVKSASNLRQLGGYTVKDGRKVKENVLFRAGVLDWLNEKDIKKLSEVYNVKYIVDMRTEEEVTDSADKVIPGAVNIWTPIYGGKMYDKATLALIEKVTVKGDSLKTDLAFAKNKITTKKFECMPLSEKARQGFKQFFDILLKTNDGEAVIWHCSKGKDRTGMASALLLYALGADDATVMKDFMLTNIYYKDDVAEAFKIARENGLNDDEAEEFMAETEGVRDEHLKTAINSITANYGSIHDYLIKGLGLTENDLLILQNKYLE